jgi:hypothetical protein
MIQKKMPGAAGICSWRFHGKESHGREKYSCLISGFHFVHPFVMNTGAGSPPEGKIFGAFRPGAAQTHHTIGRDGHATFTITIFAVSAVNRAGYSSGNG